MHWVAVGLVAMACGLGVRSAGATTERQSLPTSRAPERDFAPRWVGRLQGGLGVANGYQLGYQVTGSAEYWFAPHVAVGGNAGIAQTIHRSHAHFVAPTLSFRSARDRYWLAALGAGVGRSAFHEVYCSEDISWNEGYCDRDEEVGWGPHVGALLGRTGDVAGGREVGLLLRADFTGPAFLMTTLNVAWAW